MVKLINGYDLKNEMTVYTEGHLMTVKNVKIVKASDNITDVVRYEGFFIDKNHPLKNTGYNGAVYGQNANLDISILINH